MTATPDAGTPRTQPLDWSCILDELKNQMVRATFDAHLLGSRLVEQDGDRLVVAVRTERSVEWIQHGLDGTIARVASAVAGHDVEITYVVNGATGEAGQGTETGEDGKANRGPVVGDDDRASALSDGSTSDSERAPEPDSDEAPEFTGFHPISSNYTQTPDLFFDWVLPHAHGTVAKLVGAVIRQTIGTFIDKRHNRRREEWPANVSVVMRAAGINSRASLYTALWDARADGYLVMRDVDDEEASELSDLCGYPVYFTLRIRYQDEPADHPEEERPGYGAKRK